MLLHADNFQGEVLVLDLYQSFIFYMRLLGKYFSLRTKSTKKWWSQHFKAFSQSFQLKCQYQFSVKNIQVQYQLEKMTLCTARLPVLRIHLRAFDDFKNKQQKCMKKWFLICKSIYILKVYSKTYIEIKRKCWKNSSGQNKRYKKCTIFFFLELQFITVLILILDSYLS